MKQCFESASAILATLRSINCDWLGESSIDQASFKESRKVNFPNEQPTGAAYRDAG